MIRLVALVACGTRTVPDAVFGPPAVGEIACVDRLPPSLYQGMILLGDRNFDVAALYPKFAATNADLLLRVKTDRKPVAPQRFCDGSYLSQTGGVRVVQCQISIATTGRHTGMYRLACTLLDPVRYPALDLVKLDHERWEIETCYLEIKSTILGGRVLRAHSPTALTERPCP